MPHAGIILEIQSDHVVVMETDGRFLRLPRRADMNVGMEVLWEVESVNVQQPVRQPNRRAWKTSTWRRVGSAAVAACLIATAGVWFALSALTPTTAEAYAMVSLDINPSVSMQVDKNLKVKSADGINQDGKYLLQQIHVDGQPLQSAISMIVDAAVSHQMVPDEDTILVTTAPAPGTNDADVSALETRAKASVEQAIDANTSAKQLHPTVYALNLSQTVWDAAHEANVSPGKLAAYLVAGQEGIHVDGVNQMYGTELGKVLAGAQDSTVKQILSINDAKRLAQFIQSLQSTVVTPPAEQIPSVTPGQPPTGPKPGKGNGNGNSNGKGSASQGQHDGAKKHTDSATIHIGGTTVSIPLGNMTSVVTGKQPDANNSDEHGDHHSGSTDDQDQQDGEHHGSDGHSSGSDGHTDATNLLNVTGNLNVLGSGFDFNATIHLH